jgi:hypothetical protein
VTALKAADFFKTSNPWLAEHLSFGRPAYASRLVSALRRQKTVGSELNRLRVKCAA